MEPFSDILKRYLDAKSVSRRSIAKELGIDHSLLSYISNGKRSCPLQDLDAWMDTLAVPAAERPAFREAALMTHANKELAEIIIMKNTLIKNLKEENIRLNNNDLS